MPAAPARHDLSAAQMTALASRAKAGDRAAADELVRACRGLIRKTANRYADAWDLDADDVEAVGLGVFDRAVRYFNPARSKFLTFFAAVAAKAMLEWVRQEGPKRTASKHESEMLLMMADDGPDPAALTWTVADALAVLDPVQREVFLLMSTFAREVPLDARTAGRFLGLTEAQADKNYRSAVSALATRLGWLQAGWMPPTVPRWVGHRGHPVVRTVRSDAAA